MCICVCVCVNVFVCVLDSSVSIYLCEYDCKVGVFVRISMVVIMCLTLYMPVLVYEM